MVLSLLAAAIVITALLWNLSRRVTARQLQNLIDQRRATSQIVSRGEFFDRGRRLAVALALTDKAFYYENAAMHASLDRDWIEEVIYDTVVGIGRNIIGGEVLRLRCHRQMFEFVLSNDVVLAWKAALPPTHPTPVSGSDRLTASYA